MTMTQIVDRARGNAAVAWRVAIPWLALLLPGLPAATAMQQPSPAAAQDFDAERARRELLEWLDSYLRVELLFKKEDLRALRDKIGKMSDKELFDWLERTEEVRAALDSDEWRETREWLRDFLPAQAYYSQEDLDKMRQDAAKMSPDELMQLLEKIRNKHRQLTRMRQASDVERQASLTLQQNLARQQAQAQAAAARARRTHNSYPLFGNNQAHAVQKKYSGYSVPPPLITTREVAERAVYRAAGGRGWRW